MNELARLVREASGSGLAAEHVAAAPRRYPAFARRSDARPGCAGVEPRVDAARGPRNGEDALPGRVASGGAPVSPRRGTQP